MVAIAVCARAPPTHPILAVRPATADPVPVTCRARFPGASPDHEASLSRYPTPPTTSHRRPVLLLPPTTTLRATAEPSTALARPRNAVPPTSGNRSAVKPSTFHYHPHPPRPDRSHALSTATQQPPVPTHLRSADHPAPIATHTFHSPPVPSRPTRPQSTPAATTTFHSAIPQERPSATTDRLPHDRHAPPPTIMTAGANLSMSA